VIPYDMQAPVAVWVLLVIQFAIRFLCLFNLFIRKFGYKGTPLVLEQSTKGTGTFLNPKFRHSPSSVVDRRVDYSSSH